MKEQTEDKYATYLCAVLKFETKNVFKKCGYLVAIFYFHLAILAIFNNKFGYFFQILIWPPWSTGSQTECRDTFVCCEYFPMCRQKNLQFFNLLSMS
jgi:hypothetical protein